MIWTYIVNVDVRLYVVFEQRAC